MYKIVIQNVWLYKGYDLISKNGVSIDLYVNNICKDVFEGNSELECLNKLFEYYPNLSKNLNIIQIQKLY